MTIQEALEILRLENQFRREGGKPQRHLSAAIDAVLEYHARSNSCALSCIETAAKGVEQ